MGLSQRAKSRLWLSVVVLGLVGGMAAGQSEQRLEASILLESRAALRRAMRYLASVQKENGSWQDHPAITALVVTAMLGSKEEDFSAGSAPVQRGLAYVRSFAQPDGGIYDRFYASYSTSVCAMALVEAGLAEDKPLLERAKEFLLRAQADEEEGFASANPQYGGWGYEKQVSGEGMRRPDLSNTQLALEAIRHLEQMAEEDKAAAGTGEGAQTRIELSYGRAIQFLQRCQNLKAFNDQPWAGDDGGFVYLPGESKAGEASPEGGLRSYASMTYAGLKSMVYARLHKNDPRVQAAYSWIQRHWSVTENPGLGQQGLYYYYLTMARALTAYGAQTIVDSQGRAHDWRAELLAQLLRTQRADGSWVNENGRWMENLPELCTAYAALAIEHAMASQ